MAATKLNSSSTRKGDDPSQKHILYTKHYHQVEMVNDLYDGVDSTIKYLFQFPQENPNTFKIRQDRATLRNFVKRAVQAFTGMIFRKPIEISGYGPRTTKLLATIDTTNTIENFSKEVAAALTKDGITFVLADSPDANSSDSDTDRPYLMLIPRQQVINWRVDQHGKYTMLVIEEVVSEADGLFGTTYITQWRLYDEDANITIYRRRTTEGSSINHSGYYIHTPKIITAFDEIPIVKFDIDATPILYDIAKMNIKHFNRLSHKDRYLTMAALPIPVIWGADIDNNGDVASATPALVIGVDEAFIFNGTKDEADFQWRELSGTSVELLEADLSSITEDITTGILRAAENASSVQKTATEVQLLQAEASNRVTAISNSVEVGMTRALSILSKINKEDVPEHAIFLINKDFNAALMGSDGMRIVLESYLTGLVSMETFLQSMSDMELIAIESATKEIERIKADDFVPVPRGPLSKNTDKRTLSVTKTTESEE